MTKDERITGFLAGYKTLCEKFDVFVMGCHLCDQLLLMPANLIVGGVPSLLDLLKTHTEHHNAPFQWEHFHGVQETVPNELPSPQN